MKQLFLRHGWLIPAFLIGWLFFCTGSAILWPVLPQGRVMALVSLTVTGARFLILVATLAYAVMLAVRLLRLVVRHGIGWLSQMGRRTKGLDVSGGA